VQRLARSRKVAYLTHWLFLPHSEKKALRWIDFTANNFARRSSVEFAIQLKHGGRMVGLVGRNPNLEPRTSNLELLWAGKASQSHPKATPRPVDRHRIGTPKPPQGYTKATPRLHQGYPKAIPRLSQGYPKAPPRLHQGYPKATPRLPQGYPKATPKPGEPHPGTVSAQPPGAS
jgi:hypothetical protein